jgi:hypothetical protein
MRHLIRWLAPFGIIELRRRRFQLRQLEFPASDSQQPEEWPKRSRLAIVNCGHAKLREAKQPWTLVDVGRIRGKLAAGAARPSGRSHGFGLVHMAFPPLPWQRWCIMGRCYVCKK